MNNQNNKGMETVEEAVILKLTGTGMHASDRELYLSGAKFGAQWAKQQSDGPAETKIISGDLYQLFDHMSQEHGLTPLDSQMHEIIHVVNKIQGSDGDRWVSVDERTPEQTGYYLAFKTDRAQCFLFDSESITWHGPWGASKNVTHWRNLPSPPTK